MAESMDVMDWLNESLGDYPFSEDLFGDPMSIDQPSNQPSHGEAPYQAQDEQINSAPSPDQQFFVDQFLWTENNLPYGMSFDSEYRIPTPEFMAGWNYEPYQPARPEDEEEDQVVFIASRGTEYRAELAKPPGPVENATRVRQSARHRIAPRAPFPSRRPAWVLLATDFNNISTIPGDIELWCPCCARTRERELFRMTLLSQVPVETCIECRKGGRVPMEDLAICWSAPPEYKGCGRLLPKSQFSGFITHESFTGIFCHDCRAFGHHRARGEGRYIEKRGDYRVGRA
ncbi:hypothetical protein F4677DRAFT_443838 [Hypoxylon crocopeplum]|nr:hypothetical protein F4677DRAFT_443838 [Hypoxylon crocopeplum]